MEAFASDSVLSIRECLTVIMLSGVLTLASTTAFRRNASTRQVFMLLSVVAAVLVPAVLTMADVSWSLAMREPPALTLDVSLPSGLLYLWLTVAVWLTGRQAKAFRSISRLVGSLPIVAEPRIAAQMRRLKRQLGVRGDVLVREGPGPCSTTLGAATVVLPADHRTWSDNTLRAVLSHELVHVRRRDDRWMLCVRLVVGIYWWMPWLRWLYWRYIDAMEESCDDQASELFAQRTGYLDGVVEVARNRLSQSLPGLPGLGHHHLVARVGRFANVRDLQLDTPRLYWLMLVLVFIVVLITSVQPVQLALGEKHRKFVLVEQPVLVSSAVVYPNVSSLITEAPRSGAAAAQLSRVSFEPTPIYPGAALRKRVEGDVLVEYHIAADGRVVRADVAASHPPGVFDDAAMQALLHTRYASFNQVDRALPGIAQTPLGEGRIRKYYRFRLRTHDR